MASFNVSTTCPDCGKAYVADACATKGCAQRGKSSKDIAAMYANRIAATNAINAILGLSPVKEN